MSQSRLTVLAVDDEAPALDELAYLLGGIPISARCTAPADATSALRELHDRDHRRDLPRHQHAGAVRHRGGRCGRSTSRTGPPVVFVTAHDDKAVAAFDVGAVDYLLKPIREDRLDEAVRRVSPRPAARPNPRTRDDDPT